MQEKQKLLKSIKLTSYISALQYAHIPQLNTEFFLENWQKNYMWVSINDLSLVQEYRQALEKNKIYHYIILLPSNHKIKPILIVLRAHNFIS